MTFISQNSSAQVQLCERHIVPDDRVAAAAAAETSETKQLESRRKYLLADLHPWLVCCEVKRYH